MRNYLGKEAASSLTVNSGCVVDKPKTPPSISKNYGKKIEK
ncbi:MAG: hypothetical protein ABFC84_08530 [Veillonellales bacterium]